MFLNRIDEIKSITNLDPLTFSNNPEGVSIDDFLFPSDILYLLEVAPKLTESISHEAVETYRLSPYNNDVVKLLSHTVSKITGLTVEQLSYICLYNIKENSTFDMKGFSLSKIKESPVANSPHGKILAIGVLELTDATLKVCGTPVPTKTGRLILTKTVDVNPEVCNNSILNSSAYSNDVWICTFMFAEQPRELI